MFREGCPRWSVFFAALWLVPLAAAPLCVVLRLPLWIGMTFGILVGASAIYFLRNQLPASRRRTAKRVCAALVALVGCAALYSRGFSGLPAWISSDAGNHASIVRELLAGQTGTYNGCISMYLAWHLVDRLLFLNPFWSFVVVFYAVIVLFSLLPLAIAFVVLEKFSPRAWAAGAITSTVALGAGLFLIALPLVHYLQVEGFWTQLFALVPLFLVWWLDVVLAIWWQRILLVALGVAAFRYTYGLNLPELIGAFAVVLVADVPSRLRPYAIVAVAGPFLAGSIALRMFNDMVGMWGWFVAYESDRAVVGGLCAVAALALAALGDWLLGARLGLLRTLRVPLLFVIGSFAITAWHRVRLPRSYYVLKYPLLAICVAVAAFAVVLGASVARVVEERRLRDAAWSLLAAAAVAAASFVWWTTFPGYRQSYWERVRGVTGKELRPLADLEAWRRIDDRLSRDHKKFGGYLVAYAPMSNFMNSAMGVANGQKFYFEGRAPKEGPGYCVFWDATHPDTWPDFNRWYRHRYLVDRFGRDKARQCEEYPARWDASLRRTLCHLCK